MKTAVSIPDDVFEKAEALARKLGLSRSALYRRALEEMIKSADDKIIRTRINEVLKEVGQRPDPFMKRAARKQLRAMGRVERVKGK